jgi:hypothetical protein
MYLVIFFRSEFKNLKNFFIYIRLSLMISDIIDHFFVFLIMTICELTFAFKCLVT